jgi:DNA helicase-2/ATP-dependent DNA helicase PcrA
MEEFEIDASFLEDTSRWSWMLSRIENLDAVSIMTLHSAKGLEFETVFLPGWEEGLFPHQRALDEGGRSGLEEERRLAYVGLTRAKRHCHIWFVSNRRIHGLWQSTLSRRAFSTNCRGPCRCRRDTGYVELWRALRRSSRRLALRQGRTVLVVALLAGLATRRPTKPQPRDSRQLGHALRPRRRTHRLRRIRRPALCALHVIEGELVAKSTGTPSAFTIGDRVFHLKFGNGNIVSIDGNKLTIDFDKAGQKRVLDGFVERVG